MKNRAFVFLLLLWAACGSAGVQAWGAAGGRYASDMSVNADVQADFFKRYPDLETEREVVARAARVLAAEGEETRDDKETAELLARRTRELLARRTPQEWQAKAVSLFPELGVKDSELNQLFVRHYKELQKTSPQFMEEPSWPVLLARRCEDELRPKSSAIPATAVRPKSGSPDASPTSSLPAQAGPRTSKWATGVSLILLLLIVVQPARLLIRCRRAFGGTGGPVTLWQRALGPTAWGYLAVALIALTRTFVANADQGFLDRFGITLLVSVVAGVVFAVPVYGVALGSLWWWRQRAPSTPQAAPRDLPESAVVPAGGRKP